MGLVIELRPEMEARYRALHADPWEAVLRRITGSNIRDYSIYLARVHGASCCSATSATWVRTSSGI